MIYGQARIKFRQSRRVIRTDYTDIEDYQNLTVLKGWFHYVDNTFVVSTIEKEKNSQLVFLERSGHQQGRWYIGSLSVQKSDAHGYLPSKSSNHHPNQMRAVVKILIHRASNTCVASTTRTRKLGAPCTSSELPLQYWNHPLILELPFDRMWKQS